MLNLIFRKNEQRDDGIEDDKLVAVPYRGEYITMLYIEYLNLWCYMSRKEKNAMLETQMKALKQGKIKKRQVGDVYYVESTENGKDIAKRTNNKIAMNESNKW